MDVNDNYNTHHEKLDEENDLLEELPERDEINKVEIDCDGKICHKVPTNDSGLETCDSMDIARDENVMPELAMTSLVPLCSENTSDVLKNFTFTKNEETHSVDIAKDENTMPKLTLMTSLIPLCPENASDFPKNFTFTQSAPKLPELTPLPPSAQTTPLDSPEKSCDSSRRSSSSTSFIDSLLSKIGRRKTIEDYLETPNELPHESSTKELLVEDLLDEINAPLTFQKSSNPNMMPTPFVKNQRVGSAFVNSDEEFERTLAKHENLRNKNQLNIFDKSKMTCRSQPPKMHAPNYPMSMPKPRTLAEKRMLVNTNVDFLMIEQETKIFKQIQKKKSGEPLNYNVIDSMMNEDIPIKYGPWKALQWLRTQEGSYFQQQISIDGVNFKLAGSRGDHKEKFLPPQTARPYQKIQTTSLRSLRCCAGGKIKKKDIDNIVSMESIRKFALEESLEPFKRLEPKTINGQLNSIKPRPLSKKIEYLNKNKRFLKASEDSAFLGEFSKFKMPDIKLEVNVQQKVPINPFAKQYLYDILPSRDMNENWINFALSTMRSEAESERKAFEFTVPYSDNKQHVLVRDILKSKQDTEKLRIVNSTDDDVDDMEWTFAANADKSDSVEMEIVDIIKDLTNSVFINLNDDLFTMEDPEDRLMATSPIESKTLIETTLNDAKSNKTKKVLNELRRLNANVVKTESSQGVDEEDIRRHATAHLGKEERELRATVIVTESSTLLLGNKEKETRRRKRIPKKFNDYLHPNAKEEDDEKEIDLEPVTKKSKQTTSKEEPAKVKSPPPESVSHDDIKAIRQEVTKWLHVNVELNRMEVLNYIQPWCIVHNAYKCACKSVSMNQQPLKKMSVSRPTTANNSLNSSRCASIEKDEKPYFNIEEARRVLPVEIMHEKPIQDKEEEEEAEDDSSYELPKMEIINIGDLVNNKFGPIYINIYDTKKNRLNPVFRTILNNKSALVYIDGYAYYIDTSRVDVMKMKFDKMLDRLVHPIFIVQPKIAVLMRPESICDDFVELLFKKDDEDVIKGVTSKAELNEVSNIIEIVLRSVKKKIELQIPGNHSEHIKDQLNKIHRDRLSSGSSANTSPLHFNGQQLVKAPSPGRDSELMKEFNRIFSIRMQRLCAMIKTNALTLHPLESYINKFYIYKWSFLLRAFETHTIHIWQARLIGESGESYLILAVTDVNQPPAIENVARGNVKNIRDLSLATDGMTELTRLILLQTENVKTRFMTVVLYGCSGYFRICGMLHNQENFSEKFAAKPTRLTHPRLTAKIQKIYNIWHGMKLAKVEKSKLVNNEVINNVSKRDSSQVAKEDNSELNSIKERKRERIIDVEADSKENLPDTITNKICENDIVTATKTVSTYKWFLFNITDDFSHIYIKQWHRYLPYKIVMEAVEKARSRQKTIQLISAPPKTPNIYAVPGAPLKFKDSQLMTKNFLIVGPYLRSSNSNLMLMQNHGGKMFLRDEFEKQHKIARKIKTRCIWIYADTLKCIQNTQIEPMYFYFKKVESSQYPEKKGSLENSKEDDKEKAVERSEKGLKISSIIGGFNDKF